ncbi:phage portal protein [Pseudonocardia sp. RS010]|uniref:phage portal protein n=1 Tax=Pseudonocardia sp. RS010 TaxID=3385979 RepID=UPI0039A17E5E
MSEATALSLSAVFRSVSLIADAVAGLPLRTLEESDGQQRRVASFLDEPGGERFTRFEWAQLVMVHLLLQGNAYLQHMFNGAGGLVGLYPVHPSMVTPVWDDARPGGKRFDIKVKGSDGLDRIVSLDSSTMTHVMGVSLDGLQGVSPITLARMSLHTAICGDRAANTQFRNGLMVAGMITPREGEDDMTYEHTVALKNAIIDRYGGTQGVGDIMVINRKLEFQKWQLSPEDAQFIQSRTFQVDEIGRWFGIPPHLLGLTEKSTSWGQGIAEQNRGLARYTLTAWTNPIEQRVSRLLSASRKAEFDYSAFIKPAPEDEIRLLIDQVNSGLLTLNEARRIRNLPAVEGGDVPRLPAGSLPADQQTLGAANGGESSPAEGGAA